MLVYRDTSISLPVIFVAETSYVELHASLEIFRKSLLQLDNRILR